jgi:hypothetical protein
VIADTILNAISKIGNVITVDKQLSKYSNEIIWFVKRHTEAKRRESEQSVFSFSKMDDCLETSSTDCVGIGEGLKKK